MEAKDGFWSLSDSHFQLFLSFVASQLVVFCSFRLQALSPLSFLVFANVPNYFLHDVG